MSKKIINLVALATILSLASCGGSGDKKGTGADSTAKTEEVSDESGEKKAVVFTIDVKDWVATDLSKVSNLCHVMLNLPKDAKMEKNGNGGVDVKINEALTITISASQAVSELKEAIETQKSLTVNKTETYINGKLLVDEPHGMVYSIQMKDEENGIKYQPEFHCAYFVNKDKDGAVYRITTERPMDNYSLPGSTYTEENAKKLYEIFKTTAKEIEIK